MIPEKAKSPTNSLSWCKNIKVFNYLLSTIKKLGIKFNDEGMVYTFENSLENGNFKLAKQLLRLNRRFNIYLPAAFMSSSPKTLKFILTNLTDRQIDNYVGVISNKEVAYYMIDRFSDDEYDQADVIFRSWKAFTPQEYVELIIDYMGCVTVEERDRIIDTYLKYGEYYAAKVFFEEVPVCDEKK